MSRAINYSSIIFLVLFVQAWNASGLDIVKDGKPSVSLSPGNGWRIAFEENFDKPGWETNWTFKGSIGLLDQGALLGAGKELEAQLKRKFTMPAIRVEYDAAMTSEGGQGMSDLSCFVGPAIFRLGGDNNTLSDIQGPGDFVPAKTAVLIEPKKTHHVVAEVIGRWCRLAVDGQPCGDLVLKEPLAEAKVALYTWVGPSRFTNLRISTRDQVDPVPEELLKRAAEKRAARQKVVIPADKIAAVPGAIRTHATLHCIGVEWDIEGDANYNATCAVQYRQKGRSEWSKAMPLLRIDYFGYYDQSTADRTYNMLAGSILFLKPGATYEVQLSLSDPDGGNKTELRTIAMRPIPALPTKGRTFHVVPGAGLPAKVGGGTGTAKDPFQGLSATLAVAQPGDIFLMHKGDYGRFNLQAIGAPDKPQPAKGEAYIVWKAAGDGEVLLGFVDLRVNNAWLEGFHVRGNGGNGLVAKDGPSNVVLTRNTFTGFNYAIAMHGAGTDWYIADNVIVGDKDRATKKGFDDPTTGEGVELGHTSGHVVCYNTISRVSDGISYPGRNCDMYGNDIFEVSDDGLEPDGGYANVRMWGNRIHSYLAGISFQPMLCSPWYIIRNQVIVNQEIFKMRVCDRFVMVNNTFIGPKYGCGFAWRLLDCISRNNIWYHASPNRSVWGAHVMTPEDVAKQKQIINYPENDDGFKPNWKTDLDYDGFGGKPNPPGKFVGDIFLWYNTATKKMEYFGSVAAFSKFLGVEKHGVDLDFTVFEKYEIPEDLAGNYPKGELGPQLLTLKAGSKAVDTGDILPNVHDDWFTGKAPDLGAYEVGLPLPHYGARDEKAMKEHALEWVLKKER